MSTTEETAPADSARLTFETTLPSLAEYELVRNTLQKQLSNLRELGKQVLVNTLGKVFESCPDLYSISWCQYTPFFNDGDPCHFSVKRWSLEADGPHGTHEVGLAQARAVLSVFSDEDLHAMFGDHVNIRITPEDGLEVSEYDHD